MINSKVFQALQNVTEHWIEMWWEEWVRDYNMVLEYIEKLETISLSKTYE